MSSSVTILGCYYYQLSGFLWAGGAQLVWVMLGIPSWEIPSTSELIRCFSSYFILGRCSRRQADQTDNNEYCSSPIWASQVPQPTSYGKKSIFGQALLVMVMFLVKVMVTAVLTSIIIDHGQQCLELISLTVSIVNCQLLKFRSYSH